jgi:hypothetical protein
MATLKLLMPNGKAVYLNNPLKRNSGLKLIILNLLNIVSLITLCVFAFLAPVSSLLFQSDSETASLRFLLILVFLFLVIFIIKIALRGNKLMNDPKGLLFILVFNLLLTTVSITVTTLRVSSAFGTTGFRYMSGIALMSLIGLFYFINLYAVKINYSKLIINLFSLGTLAYLILINFSASQTITQTLSMLPLIFIGFGIAIFNLNKVTFRPLWIVTCILYVLLLIINVPVNAVTAKSLFYFSILTLITYLLLAGLIYMRNKSTVKAKFRELKNNIPLLLAVIAPVILFISSVVFFLNISPSSRSNVFVDVVQQYQDGFRLVTGNNALNGNNIRSILLGVGGDNYNPSKSFLVNVLIVFGILGVVVHFALWGYFIKLGRKLLFKSTYSSIFNNILWEFSFGYLFMGNLRFNCSKI